MAEFRGKVAWYSSARGFGFLSAEGMKEIFCHVSALVNGGCSSLREGAIVEFDVDPGSKVPRASNVRIVAE